MYDIVFLSYHEEHAEQHWELLRKDFPRACRVDGVDGLVAAHKKAASLCRTKYFWVVDADNTISPDFKFDFRWDRRDEHENRVAVWRAVNNVNGLAYGYGGVKLLPRRAVLAVDDGVTDFTTSISDFFHPVEEIASKTVINATPFEAWKAGYRECVKLASNIIRGGQTDDNKFRLDHWRTFTYEVPNAEHVLRGANQGAEYGGFYNDDPVELARINDWGWLHDRFHRQASVEV